MAIYSVTISTLGLRNASNVATTTPAGPFIEIYTLSTTRPRLLEIGWSGNPFVFSGANASAFGAIGRPATIGTTPINPLRFQPEDDQSPQSQTFITQEWVKQPTSPVNFFRRIQNGGNIAQTTGVVISRFSRGLVIPPNSSIVVFWPSAVNTTSGIDYWAVIDE